MSLQAYEGSDAPFWGAEPKDPSTTRKPKYETVDQALAALPARGAVSDCSLSVDLTDGPSFFVSIRKGEVRSGKGASPDAPIARLRSDTEALLGVLSGVLDPRTPIQNGRLVVEGDDVAAYQMLLLFPQPGGASALSAEYEALADAAVKRWAALPTPTRIERTENAKPHDVIAALETGTPFLTRGAVDWPAMEWTPDLLRERYGELPIFARGRRFSMRELIDRMEASEAEPIYAHGGTLPRTMWREVLPPPFFGTERKVFNVPQLWMGAAARGGPSTSLHRDYQHGLQVQIFGRKRFVMFSPDQYEILHRGTNFDGYVTGGIDPENPDLEAYPEYRDATPIEVVLEPGDVFLIPIGWLHTARALEATISISHGLDAENVPPREWFT